MPTTPLFPLPEGLEITSISEGAEEVLVRVTSQRQTSPCPCCAIPSSVIHSYYRRKPQDLPCAGRPIRLLLTVKKFFCRVPDCPRKIFVERLPDLIAVSSRLTLRLRSAVQEISLATCGKGGERLAGKLGIPLSDATLLWSLYLVPVRRQSARSKCWALMIGAIGVANAMARSWSTCKHTRSSTCYPTERSPRWLPGWRLIRKSRL